MWTPLLNIFVITSKKHKDNNIIIEYIVSYIDKSKLSFLKLNRFE